MKVILKKIFKLIQKTSKSIEKTLVEKNMAMNEEVKKIYNEITNYGRINLYRKKGVLYSWNNDKNCLILNWDHITFIADKVEIYFLCEKYHIVFYKNNDKIREFTNLGFNKISKTINDFLVIELI